MALRRIHLQQYAIKKRENSLTVSSICNFLAQRKYTAARWETKNRKVISRLISYKVNIPLNTVAAQCNKKAI